MHRTLVVVAVLLIAPAASAEEVSLTFDSPDEAQTVLVEPLGSDEKSTCTTPCTIRVPPGRYHVAAEAPGLRRWSETRDVNASRDFRLRAASDSAHGWGVALASIGGAITFMGLYFAVPAFIAGADSGPTEDWTNAGLAAFGGLMAGIGAVPLLGGLLLMRGNRPGPEN